MHLLTICLLIIFATVGCNLTARAPVTPTVLPTSPPLFATTPPDPNATTPPQINPDCPATPFDWIPYVVEAGDSLSLLAEQTTSNMTDLMGANCLASADEIFVGQTLYLPRTPVIASS